MDGDSGDEGNNKLMCVRSDESDVFMKKGKVPWEADFKQVSCWQYRQTEQGLTSHQTHYRSYQGRFYRSYDQTNSVKELAIYLTC